MPDLGATILSLAGATANYTLDGRPMSFASPAFHNSTLITLSLNDTATMEEPRHTITEYWNIGIFEGIYSGQSHYMRRTDSSITKELFSS